MKKDYKLDFIRIFAMFLVIVIHVSNIYSRNFGNISINSYFFATVFNGISRVSVPLFFMISGALLVGKNDDFKIYFKRLKKLLLVLLSWSIIYYIWDITVMGYDRPVFITMFNSLYSPIKAHLWFMYALIGIYIVLPFVRKLFHNTTKEEDKLFIYLWMFFTGFVYLFRIGFQILGYRSSITYPVPIIQGTYYLGYFILGYIVYKYIKEINIKEKTMQIIVGICLSMIILGTFAMSMINGNYYELLFGYRNLLYIISSGLIMIYILKNDQIINVKTIKIINFISPYSFGIYLAHVIFLNLLNMLDITIVHSLVGIPIYSISIFILSFLLVYFISKIKYIKEII